MRVTDPYVQHMNLSNDVCLFICLSVWACVSLYCNDCNDVDSSSNEADDDDIGNMMMIRMMIMITMTIVIITATITVMEMSLFLLIMMTGQMFAVLLDVQD